jgi:inositol hexakisphosphate/diphosphoinositol-pentakisphosphate kinase
MYGIVGDDVLYPLGYHLVIYTPPPQVVIMLYEDPTKEQSSEERFHVELHFSPGVNCCVEKDLPPGPGFRPHSRNKEQVISHTSSWRKGVKRKEGDGLMILERGRGGGRGV